MSTELTIVIPTFNERSNIRPVLDSLDIALKNLSWEVIFVDDDSPDGTIELVKEIAKTDSRVRYIHRINRNGLSSACIEGILSSDSPFVAVMDADMQHDEGILPYMLTTIKNNDLDLVIGSRYMTGGSTGKLPRHRVWISRIATTISALVLRQRVNDPMSGYFILKRSFFEKVMRRLSGRGFKILLDIIVSAGPEMTYRELPYVMRQREQGESKLGIPVIWEFLVLVAYRLLGRLLPPRFISFSAVGLSGIFVHMSALWFLFRIQDVNFLIAQALATFTAMTSNFILNNIFTYSDQPLKGFRFLRGLLSFYLACSLGAVINVAVADFIFTRSIPWWIAGATGAIAGAVWNYATTAIFTWGIHAKKDQYNKQT